MLSAEIITGFDPEIFRRGEAYFHDGRVEIIDSESSPDDGWVSADVSGSELYEVDVRWIHGEISSECTCPYFEDNGACKHIAAVLLAADRQGLLPPPFSDRAGARPAPRRKVPAAPKAKKAKTPPWQSTLRNIQSSLRYIGVSDYSGSSSSKGLPAGSEILYVLQPNAWSGSPPAIRPLRRAPKLDGSLDRPKKLDITIDRIADLPEVDRTLIASLAGLASQDFQYGGRLRDSYSLTFAAMRLLLPQISRTNRLFWSRETGQPSPDQIHRLTWSETPLDVELQLKAEGKNARLDCILLRGDERYTSHGNAITWLGPGVVVVNDVAGLLRNSAAAQWFEQIATHAPIACPLGQVWKLLEQLKSATDLPPLVIDPALGIQTESPVPAVLVHLQKTKYGYSTGSTISASMSFDYAGHVVPLGSTVQLTLDQPSRRVFLRNRPAELGAWEALRSLGFTGQDYMGNATIPEKKVLPAILEMVRRGWHVEAERLGSYRAAGAFSLNLTSGIDWFELHGQAQFDDQTIALPKLLEALRKGEQFVKLDDGSIGILPEQWLKQLAPIASAGAGGEGAGDAIRFKPSQAALLDILLQQLPQATWDAQFQRLRDQLYNFSGIKPMEPPATFVGTLRDYQKEGLGWFEFLRGFGFGGCLADDMGLGKTVQVLAMLEQRRTTRPPLARARAKSHRPSLVVAPRSLVFNWIQEAARFTPHLKVLDHTGTARANWTDQIDQYDLVLTTYGTLRKDAARLKDIHFDYVILDESQAIKNASTATAKAARLLNGEHRLALSGTPIENHLRELWSLFDFLNPGMLGSAAVFRQLAASEEVSSDMARFLGRALRPFILRRTKGQVAQELPERTEQTIYCELEGEQKKQYEHLRDHYRHALMGRIDSIGLQKTQMQVLEALLRLRQAACHPALLDKARQAESSPKLETLIDQIREVTAEGHKALVFSQFTSFLAILRKHLDQQGLRYEYLDGQTHDRQSRVETFQNDATCRLFLISLKAGGLGLNLTAAEYVFLLDPWWNPAVENQAIDRAHRIGQQNQVFAYRLISRGTVEEKVLELQQRKRDLADAIINASAGPLASLTREDLELLLT